MHGFEARRPSQPGEVPVSIKVSVVSGCFHRDHSPRAYALIRQHLTRLSPTETEFAFEEHESGPEILVYVAAGIALAKSVIDLVVAIIKARSEGVKAGDVASEPVELIVRRTVQGGTVQEEMVLRFNHTDPVSAKVVGERLGAALDRLLGIESRKAELEPPAKRQGKRNRKRP
jgi:hypothetical protein